jgi:hypothetical protein
MNQDDYVFISYSRRDSQFVEKLSSDLRERGISTWIDTAAIQPGTNWKSEIERALRNASALIFVISPDSTKSQWMIRELTATIQLHKTVLPVIIQDVDETELPSAIREVQWADFRASYSDGFGSLLRGLESISRSSTPLEAPVKKSKGYVFLSYAEEDTDFAQELKHYLKKRKYAYWDYAESDRDYHNLLFLELEGVITEASATLSILSESWKRSKWAVKEFVFSEDVGTPVFLLQAKPMGPTLAVAGMTFIDFMHDIESGFRKLDKELSRKNL